MKKSYLIIISSFLFSGLFLFSCSDDKKNDLAKANLKGPVKDVEYRDKNILTSEVKYNLEGNITEEKDYSSGRLDMSYLYKYDDNGNLIKKVIEYHTGIIIDGEFYSETYKYDDNGNRIESRFNRPNGDLQQKTIYKYDDNGNKMESINNSPKGDLQQKTIYKYDDNGNRIEESMYKYGSDSILVAQYFYKYDDNGNKIEERSWEQYGRSTKFIYKYDKYDVHENWVSVSISDSTWSKWHDRVNTSFNNKKRAIGYYSSEEVTAYNSSQDHTKSKEEELAVEMPDEPLPDSRLRFKDIEITLLDYSINKCTKILGEPDTWDYLNTGVFKAYIYFDKVLDENGNAKHLVLFFRYNSNDSKLEELKAVGNNEKAYFGNFYVIVKNGKVSSNARSWGL